MQKLDAEKNSHHSRCRHRNIRANLEEAAQPHRHRRKTVGRVRQQRCRAALHTCGAEAVLIAGLRRKAASSACSTPGPASRPAVWACNVRIDAARERCLRSQAPQDSQPSAWLMISSSLERPCDISHNVRDAALCLNSRHVMICTSPLRLPSPEPPPPNVAASC